MLLAADLVALTSACVLVSFLTASLNESSVREALAASAVLTLGTLALWRVVSALSGLYRRDEWRADLTVTDDVVPVVVIVSLAHWAAFVVFVVAGAPIPTSVLVGLWSAAIVFLLGGRAIARTVARTRPEYVESMLIVGAGDVGQLLGRKLAHHPELGLRLVGFVDDDPKAMRRDLLDVPVLGTPDDIAELVEQHGIRRIVIAFSNERHDRQLEIVHELRSLDVEIDVVPRLFEAVGPQVGVHYVEGMPLMALAPVRTKRLARLAKRGIDIVASASLLALLSPMLVFLAWKVKRSSPGPIFFRQERLGESMKPFELLKFRTMWVDTDDAPHREYIRTIMDPSQPPTESQLYKLDRSDAVTEFGSWLRRTSLDELPQLINVLRGDMSLVGPRPCMPYVTDLCEPSHFDRFLVPAGMTGLWQVTARAQATFKEALDLDAAYARNWSLMLDIKLLLRTPFVVFGARGTV